MGRKLSQKEFINKANTVHNNKYDYSLAEYTNSHDYIKIICPIHGVFEQKAYKHLQGNGCPQCVGNVKKTTEQFIEEAKRIHGNKYDYSKVDYVNTEAKVRIICPEHGEFYQKPYSHLQGKGCPKCNGGVKLTTEEFINKAIKIHGDKYDYSKTNYINNKTKVCIICPKHGEFYQTPNEHLDGCGCPVCRNSRLENLTKIKLDELNIEYVEKYKTSWLKQQHLDFYIPLYNIGIECQGKQHFKPVAFFGGDSRFHRQIELDEQKRRLCGSNGVRLLYITNEKDINELLTFFKEKNFGN